MRVAVSLARMALTAAILIALYLFITPAQARADLRTCDWPWAGAAVTLAPLFLFCRVAKWRLLEQQVLGSITWRQLLPRYLWGMAIGLVTPGRVGELARLRAPALSARGGGLFLAEKLVEVSCLLGLCLLTLPVLGLLPGWMVLPIAVGLALAAANWRRLLDVALGTIGRVVGRPSPERRQELTRAVSTLRIGGCTFLSLACFVVYIVQAYWVLRALGVAADPLVALHYPLVLLANLVPITVGGYGVRETLAAVVLQLRNIPEAKAAASVALVTFFNLVLPGLLGVVLRVFGKGVASVPDIGSQPVDVPTEAEDWDTFWEVRNRRPLGRVLAWFRQRFVTARLARYIRENTGKGTLVEAGCGSGEVTLQVAAERGDQVVLVDHSSRALALAGRLARTYGIDARLVECDIAELSRHVRHAAETIVYNIGVIEHFEDPSRILREMASVSDHYAIALIPERSAFWLTFFQISRLLGLVPRDFFVQFLCRRQLADLVNGAGCHVRWMRRARVFGLIPYLGVCFSLSAGPTDEGQSHD